MNIQVAAIHPPEPNDFMVRLEVTFPKFDWLKIREAYLTDGSPLFTEEQKRQISYFLSAQEP